MLSRIVAGIPAVIGIAFVARYAYVTSDTAIDGASNAFLFGMIAAGAFAGPAVAVAVASNGRKRAAWIFGLLAVLAMAANWSHTLGAVAHRGAGTEAERVKAKSDERDIRATLKRLGAERGAMAFVPATTEAVQAAREAVTAAERTRLAECGPNNEKRGIRCRDRESEEATARTVLATTLANRAATDTAASLDRQIASAQAGLAKAPAVKEGNSLGSALGRILHLPAATAATFQQGLVSAIVELLIAATLALPELLRRQQPVPGSPRGAEEPARGPVTAVSMVGRPMATAVSMVGRPMATADAAAVARFMLACLPRTKGSEVEARVIYARFCRWCDEQEAPIAPLDPQAFAIAFKAWAERGHIQVRRIGRKVYYQDIQLVA